MVYLREKKLSAITAAAARAAAKIMIIHFKSSVKERTFLTLFLLQ